MKATTYVESFECTNGRFVNMEMNHFQEGIEIKLIKTWSQNITLKISLITINIILLLFAIKFAILLSTIPIFFIIILTYNLTCGLSEESILVLKNIGVQIQIKSLLSNQSTFIPWESINGIFINEVISQQRILYVLTLSINNNEVKLFPLLTNIMPRLNALENIYRVLHKTLSKN